MLYFYFTSESEIPLLVPQTGKFVHLIFIVEYFNLISRVQLPVFFECALYLKHVIKFEMIKVLSVSVFQPSDKLETSSERHDPPSQSHQPSASFCSHPCDKQVNLMRECFEPDLI